MDPHIHYGEHIILGLDTNIVPEVVLEEYYVIFGNPDADPPRGVLKA